MAENSESPTEHRPILKIGGRWVVESDFIVKFESQAEQYPCRTRVPEFDI